MKVVATLMLLVAVTLGGSGYAQAETPLERLKRMETQQPSPPVKDKTMKEVCAELAQSPNSPKCRGYYVSNGYAAEWQGINRQQSHSFPIEVLTRGDDAVVCFATTFLAIEPSLDESGPCTLLQRSR